MKIIFLDVDGVLNSADSWSTTCEGPAGQRLDPAKIQRLIGLVKDTGAKIVVSSVWRMYYMSALASRLTAAGLPKGTIIGKTPILHTARGEEILSWLSGVRLPVESFVILDDDADMDGVLSHLVKTSWQSGLQDHHIEQAKLVLSRPAVDLAQ